MQETPITKYSAEEINLLIGQIPFFKDLFDTDKKQFDAMMEHTQVQIFDKGEVIVQKGTHDFNFYSLVKGKVDVFAEAEPNSKALSQLSPGQVIGALAIINNEPRTATLAASRQEEATLIATDFSEMGELHDYSHISLSTKISFYNTVVQNIRWKLEVYKKNTTDPTLAQELQLLKPFNGKKNTVDELEHLSEHALMLGSLLDSWNDVAEATIDVPSQQSSDEKKGFFKNLFKRT